MSGTVGTENLKNVISKGFFVLEGGVIFVRKSIIPIVGELPAIIPLAIVEAKDLQVDEIVDVAKLVIIEKIVSLVKAFKD